MFLFCSYLLGVYVWVKYTKQQHTSWVHNMTWKPVPVPLLYFLKRTLPILPFYPPFLPSLPTLPSYPPFLPSLPTLPSYPPFLPSLPTLPHKDFCSLTHYIPQYLMLKLILKIEFRIPNISVFLFFDKFHPRCSYKLVSCIWVYSKNWGDLEITAEISKRRRVSVK